MKDLKEKTDDLSHLIPVVVSQAATMAELRLRHDYGDPLGRQELKCSRPEQSELWGNEDWATVATLVKVELQEEKDYRKKGPLSSSRPPPSPHLFQLRSGARLSETGMTAAQTIREIELYADRCKNERRYSVKTLIEECMFEDLGRRLYADLNLLDCLFRGRTKEAEEIRIWIMGFKNEYFSSRLGLAEINGYVHVSLSLKALRMRRALLRIYYTEEKEKEEEESYNSREAKEEEDIPCDDELMAKPCGVKEEKLVKLINRATKLTKAYAGLSPDTLREERLLEILLETLRSGTSRQRNM